MGVALVVAVVVFGLCYLVDKGYTKTFRGEPQHQTGLSVRLNKRYSVFGILLTLLGIFAMITGITNGLALVIGGVIVLLMGIALLVYYMTFGIFYDADSFILTTFGSKSLTYRFADIKEQRLYMLQGGGVIIELHMVDGRAVGLQSAMEGTYPFLDHAFTAWCRQKGIVPEDCNFHDPSQSLWFPTQEEV
jgi:hypothetical protein